MRLGVVDGDRLVDRVVHRKTDRVIEYLTIQSGVIPSGGAT